MKIKFFRLFYCLLVNFQIGDDKPGTTFDIFFLISIILERDCIKISLDLD